MSAATGGTAFPVYGGSHEADDPRNHTIGGGMTLRDYFASKALAGYYAHAGTDSNPHDREVTAHQCYQMADVMIAERAK